MAEAEGRQGHLDQARQLAERARHLDEDSTQALVVSAQIEAVQKNWKAAAEYLERVRKVAPKVTALQNLAYAYVQIPDFDRAHSAALEWYELQPQSTDAAFSLAVVFVGAKHWGEADPLLETVLSRRPNDKAAHLARGIALYNLGKLDEATKQLDASLVQGAPDAVAHYHLGLIAKQRADIPTATKEMEAAIAADPSHQQALSCLGQLYAQQGNLEQARAVLEKAVEMLPEDTQSHYQLATVYRRLSIPEKAREQFELYQRLANKPGANSNK
jgi:tetratricopeptide (TPR) repeat protein